MDLGSAALLPLRKGSQQTPASTATLDLLGGDRKETDVTMLKASTDSSTTVTVAAYAAFGSDAGAGAGSLAGAKSPGKDGGRALHSVTAAAPRLQQWPRQRRQRQQQQQQHHSVVSIAPHRQFSRFLATGTEPIQSDLRRRRQLPGSPVPSKEELPAILTAAGMVKLCGRPENLGSPLVGLDVAPSK